MQVLLHKYTTSDDIVVGSPYANRDALETHDLLGAFVNVLALRLDLSGDCTFAEALRRSRAASAQAFMHAAAPFAKVVEALDVVRSAAFTPIYQVKSLGRRSLGALVLKQCLHRATVDPRVRESAA